MKRFSILKKIISLALTLLNSIAFGQGQASFELVPQTTLNTPYAQYVRSAYSYKGIPVLQHQHIKVLSKQGALVRERGSLTTDLIAQLPTEVSGPYLFYATGAWNEVQADTVLQGSEHYVMLYNDADSWKLDLTVHATDTMVDARVFNPDPLTPNQFSYGGIYVDQNDQNATVLDSLSVLVSVDVIEDNDTLRLQNSFVKILDFDPPYTPISIDPSEWTDGRTPPAFEQVMCTYHITSQNEYLIALGYDSLMDYAIHVDPQALNGQDNSLFNWGFPTPRLYFGEGGVDDAEDADVIIHELGHAISHAAAPNSNSGTQRASYDEALGDYFAERYGRRLGIFSTRVFDWDGNNEFWSGRGLIHDGIKDYNNIFFNGIYEHTDLIVSAMLDFSNDASVGDSVADRIVLESLFSILPFDNFRQIAQEYLAADSLITGGLHQQAIYNAFGAPRNILIQQNTQKYQRLLQRPELRFDGNATILHMPEGSSYSIQVYSLRGQLVSKWNDVTHSISLNYSHSCIIKVTDEKNNVTILRKL